MLEGCLGDAFGFGLDDLAPGSAQRSYGGLIMIINISITAQNVFAKGVRGFNLNTKTESWTQFRLCY